MGGLQAWLEDPANSEKVRRLTVRHRRGLDSIRTHLLAPVRADMLASDTFLRVIGTPRNIRSHGQEAAALNQLREVHGLARISKTRIGHQERQEQPVQEPPTKRRCSHKTPPVTAAGAGTDGRPAAPDATATAADADALAPPPLAPAPALWPKPKVYEKDAVIATAAGEGSEDPFWLGVVSKRAPASPGHDIKIRWLERDARFSQRGEIFWCGKHGDVSSDFVVCQLREHWKPKQIAGWTEDSAFVCSYEEVQLVRAHLEIETVADAGRVAAENENESESESESESDNESASTGRQKTGQSAATTAKSSTSSSSSGGGGSKRGRNGSGLSTGGRGGRGGGRGGRGGGRGSKGGGRGGRGGSRGGGRGGGRGGRGGSGANDTLPCVSNTPPTGADGGNGNGNGNGKEPGRSKRATAGVARRVFDPSFLGPRGLT